jgi:hypothetical protein
MGAGFDPSVMPGLVPGIHVFLTWGGKDVDARDEPGHDGREMRCMPANPKFTLAETTEAR